MENFALQKTNFAEHYFTKYKCKNLKDDEEDTIILQHTNGIAMLCLADNHPVLKEKKSITKVDFNINNKTDLTTRKVTGKGKNGALQVFPYQKICFISCSDDTKYIVYGAIIGKLLEANERLVKNPELLSEKPLTEGYIGIIMPKMKQVDSKLTPVGFETLIKLDEPIDFDSNTPYVVLISGKRKCGKDYFGERLQKFLNNSIILRLSEPIKAEYAEIHNLDLTKLLDSTEYKEEYRKDMISWSEQKRSDDAWCFCKSVVNIGQSSGTKIWIISDARRKSDLAFFKQYRLITIRIIATESIRSARGWTFTENVDNTESECGLDDFQDWDCVIENNETFESEKNIQDVLELVKKYSN